MYLSSLVIIIFWGKITWLDTQVVSSIGLPTNFVLLVYYRDRKCNYAIIIIFPLQSDSNWLNNFILKKVLYWWKQSYIIRILVSCKAWTILLPFFISVVLIKSYKLWIPNEVQQAYNHIHNWQYSSFCHKGLLFKHNFKIQIPITLPELVSLRHTKT